MKKIIVFTLILFTIFGLVACKDEVKITPQEDIKEKENWGELIPQSAYTATFDGTEYRFSFNKDNTWCVSYTVDDVYWAYCGDYEIIKNGNQTVYKLIADEGCMEDQELDNFDVYDGFFAVKDTQLEDVKEFVLAEDYAPFCRLIAYGNFKEKANGR